MAIIDNTPVSLLAGADLSARLWRFGKISAGQVVACAVAGERADGIIGSRPTAAGQALDFQIERIMKVEAGGVFSAGPITTDSVGRAVAVTGSAYINAIALEAATAAGQLIACIPMRAVSPVAVNVADSAVDPASVSLGSPQLIVIDIPDAATTTYVYDNAEKIEIVDAWNIKDGAGAGNTIQITDSADVAITDAMAAAVDTTLTRASTIAKATRTLAASAGFKVVATRAAGSMAAQLFILVIKRA